MRLLLLYLIFPLSLFSQSIENFQNYIGKERSELLDSLIESYDEFLNTNFDSTISYDERASNFLNQYIQDTVSRRFDFKEAESMIDKWTFNLEESKKLIQDIEKSILRREIYQYGKENQKIGFENEYAYQDSILSANRKPDSLLIDLENVNSTFEDIVIIPDELVQMDSIEREKELQIDSIRMRTILSKLLVAGHKYCENEKVKKSYLIRIEIGGWLSPYLAINNAIQLGDMVGYDNYYQKTLIAIEIYYDILRYITYAKPQR